MGSFEWFETVRSLTFSYLGQAIGMNPGFLKLRKIRAAQTISKTVSQLTLFLTA